MPSSRTGTLAIRSESVPAARAVWHDYLELTKPKVVALIVFTAIAGTLLASPALPPRGRAPPSGRLTESRPLIFAAILGVTAMSILALKVNLLTAVLTFASLIGYAVVYTVWLKRATSQNIVIGGAAGAAPPVLGWTAVTGHVDPNALLLFLIIFAWTPPHFWALAIARRDDYARAGIPMLPVTHGVEYTRLHVLLYTVLLVLVTLMPFLTRMSGLIYLASALVLNAMFLYHALVMKITARVELPMRVFRFSITYLMWLFAALLVDHYLPTTQGGF